MSDLLHEGQGGGTAFIDRWQTVGTPPPSNLGEASTVLRHALRLVERLGRALSTEQAAHTQGAFVWMESHHALAGALVEEATRPFRAALRIGELTLLLLDAEGTAIKTLPLEETTPEEALAWLEREAGGRGAEAVRIREQQLAELPPLPEALHGKLAMPDRATFLELERWYANADRLLRNVARTTEDASAVRGSLDRLELATVLSQCSREGEQARIVSVGMSPGGGQIAMPYFFVRPSPSSDVADLPALQAPGRWERDDGLLAVLRADDITARADGDAQAALVQRFLASAIPAAHEVIRRQWRRRS